MTVDRAKVLKYIDGYQRRLKPDDDQRKFYLAVCQVQLRDYAEAQQLFEKSCNAMFGARPLWKDSGQPHWLVDICVLSGRTDLYPKVLRELDAYKTIPLGRSLVALYAYALMELLLPSEGNITQWIQDLLVKPKVKDTFAMGQALQAIVDRDQSALNDALTSLLKAHEGMAKHGGLRESAEGLLCMPAMSLAYAALKRNLKVEMENDYLVIGYLGYLLDRERKQR
jgi:hypothetical protein